MNRRHQVPKKLLPNILFIISAALIITSLILLYRFGAPGYFAIVGYPWHLWTPAYTASSSPSPVLQASESLAHTTLQPGQTQVLTIMTHANITTTAKIKTWVTKPPNKEVWRSPDDQLSIFPAGHTITNTYQLPTNLPTGTYQVSFLITSTNEQTDYVVKENNREFNVQ